MGPTDRMEWRGITNSRTFLLMTDNKEVYCRDIEDSWSIYLLIQRETGGLREINYRELLSPTPPTPAAAVSSDNPVAQNGFIGE